MHVEEEKAEKDTVEDRARRLEGIHLRDFFLTICDWQQKVGKEVDCEMHVDEEKAEKDTVEDRARRLEMSAAEGPSGEGGEA